MTTHLQNYTKTEHGYSIKIDDLEKDTDKVQTEWTFDDTTIESLIKLGFTKGCSPYQFWYYSSALDAEIWLYAEKEDGYHLNVKFWSTNKTTQKVLKEYNNKIQQVLKEVKKILC